MADKKPEEAPSVVASVSNEELRTSFSGPAVRSNKIYLSLTDGGVRIAFTEQHGDAVPPIFRTAVILSFADALSLRDLIARQLARIEGLEAGLTKAVAAAVAVATPEEKKDDGA